MLKIGASLETDIGVTPFHYGSHKMVNKSSVSDQSGNLKSLLGTRLKISTENTSITWPLNPDRGKDNLEESMKSSTAGLKAVQCHTLKFITHSAQLNNNSKKSSQLISSEKVLIKPEDGSTHSTLLPLEPRIWTHIRTLLSMVLFWLKMERKCQRDLKIILIQF